MPAGNVSGSIREATCERLESELEQARRVTERAEQRADELALQRDALARTNQELGRCLKIASDRCEAALVQCAELRELAAGIAHDFNNVLAVIAGGLQLLSRAAEPARRARLISRIDEAAWRGGDLTRRLLAFVRQPAETEPRASRAVEGRGLSVLAAASQFVPEHLSVLVVEDDDEMAALATGMLERLGHRGLRVSTVPAAVAVLSGGEAVDLIFSDVLLSSGGSGLDLAREIERRELRLPIVLTSGFGSDMTGRLAAARLPFLQKPYTLAALQQVLQRAARPPAPEVAAHW